MAIFYPIKEKSYDRFFSWYYIWMNMGFLNLKGILCQIKRFFEGFSGTNSIWKNAGKIRTSILLHFISKIVKTSEYAIPADLFV